MYLHYLVYINRHDSYHQLLSIHQDDQYWLSDLGPPQGQIHRIHRRFLEIT